MFDELFDWLPQHKCGLHLSHNEHKDVYETVDECYDQKDFPSAQEWQRAVDLDSVWSLQWYPETPIGFHVICAASLDVIKQAVQESFPSRKAVDTDEKA